MNILQSKYPYYFWKDKSLHILNSFISEYLDQILSWNHFSEAPGWKPLFLLKTKIKQNPGYSNKEYNAIFNHIYQNIRAYSGSKQNLHRSMIGKILKIGENAGKARRWQTNSDCSNDSLGSGTSHNSMKTLQFLPSFNLEKSISSS